MNIGGPVDSRERIGLVISGREKQWKVARTLEIYIRCDELRTSSYPVHIHEIFRMKIYWDGDLIAPTSLWESLVFCISWPNDSRFGTLEMNDIEVPHLWKPS